VFKSDSITVLIPAKNAGKTLDIAIEDISKQKGVDIKIIIANDNSSDDTLHIIKEYQRYIENIRVIEVPRPGGIVAGRNLLLKAVDTEYLAWLDADDGWNNQKKLYHQINFLKKNNNYALVGDGKINGILLENFKSKKYYFPLKNEDIQARLIFKNAFIMSSIVARTNMVQNTVFNPAYEYLEDYLWIREIAYNHPVANIMIGGTVHFISTKQQQQEKDDKYLVYAKEIELLKEGLEKYKVLLSEAEYCLVANFVRRNKKIDKITYQNLNKLIKRLIKDLTAQNINNEALKGFFFTVKLRMLRCRYLYF